MDTILGTHSTVLPIVVSIASLIVAVLAFNDQHRSNEVASLIQSEAYAAKVSFWITANKNGSVLNIQNSSTTPISDTVVLTYSSNGLAFDRSVAMGTIPPCIVGSWQISPKISFSQAGGSGGDWGNTGNGPAASEVFAGIGFTDADTVSWERLIWGQLRQSNNDAMDSDSLSAPVRSYQRTQSSGCS